ncbi:MAG TPA: ABC transporter permease subunit [Candidatus Nanoarchaeia archaeon]|nr:ABC transporter permease subunit [Candidatus Nanoarchaeia archaeon]
MRFSKSWIVTKKDLSVFRKNKYVLYSLVALPIIIGVVLPITFILALTAQSQGANLSQAALVDAANRIANVGSVYFVLIPTILPSIIASYSFVGEKIEKSLEPLLATPTTDAELLLGKSLAAFIPCLAVTFIGAAFYVSIMDAWSYGNFGVLLLPNLYWIVVMFLMAPLACVLSVEANVIISSRVNDIRAAQQLGGIVVLPLLFLVIFASTNTTLSNLILGLVTGAGLAVADAVLFSLAKATFQREEILTKWK